LLQQARKRGGRVVNPLLYQLSTLATALQNQLRHADSNAVIPARRCDELTGRSPQPEATRRF